MNQEHLNFIQMFVKKRTHKTEITFAIICLFLGMISGHGMQDHSWYDTLNKPEFNPPKWIFAPVWTALYIMMGVAFAKITTEKNKIGIILFTMQFFCNILWSRLFFMYKRVDLALYDILLLCALIFALIFHMRRNLTVFSLLIPYFLWISFASILNLYIYFLN